MEVRLLNIILKEGEMVPEKIDVDKVVSETFDKIIKKMKDKQKEEFYQSYLKRLHEALFEMARDMGLDSKLNSFYVRIDPLGDDKVVLKPCNLFTGLILMGIPLDKIPEITKEMDEGGVVIDGIEYWIKDNNMSYKLKYPIEMVTFEFDIEI